MESDLNHGRRALPLFNTHTPCCTETSNGARFQYRNEKRMLMEADLKTGVDQGRERALNLKTRVEKGGGRVALAC
ncbi:putative polypeptide N-acetylgalactosaminyltransferase 16-like [Sesbania bispinosa]|nr:putative polypeptide N-acetylgalactosaminyltransferase 16-like [Sesbania bispinosa]